jgi:hypothetical protein
MRSLLSALGVLRACVAARSPARAARICAAACRMLLVGAALGGLAGPASAAVLTTTDVSPDFPFGAQIKDLDGRIVGMVIDPGNDSVLYAASPWAGIWKSTDAAHSWRQTSNGLRNGRTQISAYPNLAIDTLNPQRLIYATSSKDGRPPFPCQSSATHRCYGGLWATLDGAASWFHVNLCAASGAADNIASVIFSAGRPFVATDCGIWSTQDAGLQDGSWTTLPALPNNISASGTILAPTSGTTLFACLGGGSQVYRSQDFGQTWDAGVPLAGRCTGLTSVLLPQELVPSTSVVIHLTSDGSSLEVTVVNHDSAAPPQDLGFANAIHGESGSGRSGVWVAPRPTNAGGAAPGPGSTYDVFAADNLQFYVYKGSKQWSNSFGLHDDTWWMVFPSTYDGGAGLCPAYAATDGGIVANLSGWPIIGSCAFVGATSNLWVGASSGLHVTYGIQISGLSITNMTPFDRLCVASQGGQPCPLLFLPSADTDTFIRTTCLTTDPISGCTLPGPTFSWTNLPDDLGDSGVVLIDPAQPNLAMAVRNGHYNLFVEPSGGPPTAQTHYERTIAIGGDDPDPNERSGPGTDYFAGIADPAPEGVKQVQTVPNEIPLKNGDFLAIRSDFPTNLNNCAVNKPPTCANDIIVRNVLAARGEETAEASWFDISPNAQFGPGQVAGIYPSGGHSKTTVYVLTSNDSTVSYAGSRYKAGTVWKAQPRIIGQPITGWTPASGSGANSLVQAFNLFVNPYDPNELYATDLGPAKVHRGHKGPTIKVSRDGGQSWAAVPALNDIATNHSEFDLSCGEFVSGPNYSILDVFGQECSLTSMLFPPGQSKLRFAVLYPGGVAFSRDGGATWMDLNIANAMGKSLQLMPMPHSAFYDPNLNAAGNSSLYVALEGRGVIRLDAPFATLGSGQIVWTHQ